MRSFDPAALLSSVFVLSLAATPAVAGLDEEESPDLARANEIAKQWRYQGSAAAPAMVRAICGDNLFLQDRAEERLIELGGGAVRALMRSAHNRDRCSDFDAPSRTLARVLWCMPNRPETRLFAHRRIVRAIGSRNTAEKRLATDVLTETALITKERATEYCPESGWREPIDPGPSLFPMAVDPLIRRIDGPDRDDVLELLSLIGPYAARVVPVVVALLNNEETASQALSTLRGMGPDAASAVPILRQQLSTATTTRKAQIAGVLGGIGSPARPALPDLIAILSDVIQEPCDFENSMLLRVTATAIAQIGGPASGDAVPLISAALKNLRKCASLPFTALVEALKTLGKIASSAQPMLLSLLQDGSTPLARRLEAGSALQSISDQIPGNASKLVEALAKKNGLQRNYSWQPRATPQMMPPPGSSAEEKMRANGDASRRRMARQHAICLHEAGFAPLSPELFQETLVRHDAAAHMTMHDCLRDRLCGPSENDAKQTLKTCCEKAYPNDSPEWCKLPADPDAWQLLKRLFWF